MYTNIKTEPAIDEISKHILSDDVGLDKNMKIALIEALHLVFENNLFKLGDTYWKQISGTGMGTPPAPPWAMLFFGLHEKHLLQKWDTCLYLYKRFIDDVFGVWLVHHDPTENKKLWDEFCSDMNSWHGLRWTFHPPSTIQNFMDLTISIVNNRFSATLYEKEMNLYLYIPPHSSHPKGVLTGLIFGQVLRIRRLCTINDDANTKISEFFTRLLARGHTSESLEPLFRRAEANAESYLRRSPAEHERLRQQKLVDSSKQVFFHLQYHPEDPRSSKIQELWRDIVANPPGELPLLELENYEKQKVDIRRLVVAYSRPLNLKNKFTVRNISDRGRPVSEYLAE